MDGILKMQIDDKYVLSTRIFIKMLFDIRVENITQGYQVADEYETDLELDCDLESRHYSDDFLRKLKVQGIIEEQDVLWADRTINRKRAAAIVHNFLQKILRLQDLQDISRAEIVNDLYDCRVCANHIAQVYLRDIMGAYVYADDNMPRCMVYSQMADYSGDLTKECKGVKKLYYDMILFEGERTLGYEDAIAIIGRLESLRINVVAHSSKIS